MPACTCKTWPNNPFLRASTCIQTEPSPTTRPRTVEPAMALRSTSLPAMRDGRRQRRSCECCGRNNEEQGHKADDDPPSRSAPALQSPMRHHKRAPSRSKDVKETLNARSHYGSSDEDGPSVHRINQYVIKQEIGRGSFGSVHLAADQFGNEFVSENTNMVAAGQTRRARTESDILRFTGSQGVFQVSITKASAVQSVTQAECWPTTRTTGRRAWFQLPATSTVILRGALG